jgi:hypothetical protein
MPKKKAADLTAKEKEQYFVSLYVKMGATADQIPACEKRAHLKVGSGKKILARTSVKKDLASRMAPVQAEKIRQQTIGEALTLAKEKMQEELAAQIELIKLHKVDFDVLQGRLMQMVVGLNMHMFPKELLETIKTAMVVHGSMQVGNTKRLTTESNPSENPAAAVYTALFHRLGSNPSPVVETLPSQPEAQEAGIYDLYPPAPVPKVPTVTGMPLPGESIEEVPAQKPSNSNVITVEVG